MRKRLTERFDNYIKLNTDSPYADKMVIDRLAEYEDLEEQGLLVELPCKVGDDCYFVHKIEEHYELLYGYVKGISIDEDNIWIFGVYKLGLPYWHTSKDKDLFFFREEAEKRLKEIKGE